MCKQGQGATPAAACQLPSHPPPQLPSPPPSGWQACRGTALPLLPCLPRGLLPSSLNNYLHPAIGVSFRLAGLPSKCTYCCPACPATYSPAPSTIAHATYHCRLPKVGKCAKIVHPLSYLLASFLGSCASNLPLESPSGLQACQDTALPPTPQPTCQHPQRQPLQPIIGAPLRFTSVPR